MSAIFNPLKLKNLTLSNRIVVSPMCQYTAEDGFANNWHLVHLGQFATGKAGAIIQEATAVVPEGRISYGDLGIWKDEHIAKYQEITNFIKEQGSIPGIQLAHAGRKASTDKPWLSRKQFAPNEENGWQTVSSTGIPYLDSEHAPKALALDEIKKLVEHFADAAERAVQSGYQIIEIHAAHGYLIHQFLSPIINNRTDEYGGSFDNRIRLLLEIVAAVNTKLDERHSLWVRISATDWADGGWDLDASVALVKLLKEAGVEVMDISTGGAVHWQKIPVEPAYQVPFATRIKQETGMITGSVGLITSANQADEIVERDQADFILIGRAFLDDPHLVYHWAKDLTVDLAWPHQYERAKS